MGTAALNQAESALETGKTQIATLKKALRKMLNMLDQVTGLTGDMSTGLSTAEEIMSMTLGILSDDGISRGNNGSVLRLESAVFELIDALENYNPALSSDPADVNSSGGSGETDSNSNPEDDASQNDTGSNGEQDNTGGADPLAEPGDGQENPATDPPSDPLAEPEADPPADPPTEPEADLANDQPTSPETGETDSDEQRVRTALKNFMAEVNYLLEDINMICSKAETIGALPNMMDGILQAVEVGSAGEFMSIVREALSGEDPEADDETLQQVFDILQTVAAMDMESQQLADQIQNASESADNIGEISDLVREHFVQILPEALTENQELPPENLRLIKEVYEANKGDIQMIPDYLEKERVSAYDVVKEAYDKLTGLKGQLNSLTQAQSLLAEQLATLRETEKELEEGEAALAEGRVQLDAAMDEQKKKAEELDKKKRDLDDQEKALKQRSEEAEEQKKLEEREKNLRAALLSREEIRRRNQYGMDLLTASEKWLEEYKEQAREKYQDRFDAGVLTPDF